MAGAALLERVFAQAGSTYGCYRDADFPKVTLLSYPFTEMLGAQHDFDRIRQELTSCLGTLRSLGSEAIAIACNTLHAFLPEEDSDDIVNLPKSVLEVLDGEETPLVLCTTASSRFALHKQFYPCVYPDKETQKCVDETIDSVLKGIPFDAFICLFNELLRKQPEETIILGCTELSLLRDLLEPSGKRIVDPLDITAKQLLERSFKNKRRLS